MGGTKQTDVVLPMQHSSKLTQVLGNIVEIALEVRMYGVVRRLFVERSSKRIPDKSGLCARVDEAHDKNRIVA